MRSYVELLVYCLVIVGVSLIGGWIPMLVRLTHRRMQVAISFVSGVMLSVGLLHLLPHAIYEGSRLLHDPLPMVFGWLMGGVLTMFFIERFFCFHHHDAPHPETASEAPADREAHAPEHTHQLSWGGAAVGLSLHSMIAGVALAAAVRAEMGQAQFIPFVGLSTFLVIFLHKPFDSLTLGTLMAAGGWSHRARHLVNALFATAVPIGVALFFLGAAGSGERGSLYVSAALAFSAGTFLCISMSDLLPELQFHHHDRIALSAALLLGLGVGWLASAVEQGSGHLHVLSSPAAATQSGATTVAPPTW